MYLPRSFQEQDPEHRAVGALMRERDT